MPLPPTQRSLKERVGALRNLRPFLSLVWQTAPGLTLANLVLRLARALLPVATLYVGKLIIDEVVRLAGVSGPVGGVRAWWHAGLLLGGAAVATGLANQMGIFEGTTVALMQQTIQYRGMVKFGDTIRIVMKVKERQEWKKPTAGIVLFDVPILNQRDEPVVTSEWKLLMARKPA